DAIVMTAAVADFRPVTRADQKIKKDGRRLAPIALTENPDILADLSALRAPPDCGRTGPGDRRLRRRDRPGPGRRPGQAGQEGLRHLGHEPGRRRPRLRHGRQRGDRARRRRRRHPDTAPLEGCAGRLRLGPGGRSAELTGPAPAVRSSGYTSPGQLALFGWRSITWLVGCLPRSRSRKATRTR